jgi:hypothetical protein
MQRVIPPLLVIFGNTERYKLRVVQALAAGLRECIHMVGLRVTDEAGRSRGNGVTTANIQHRVLRQRTELPTLSLREIELSKRGNDEEAGSGYEEASNSTVGEGNGGNGACGACVAPQPT